MNLRDLATDQGELTDLAIDRYTLRGFYGEARRDRFIENLIDGTVLSPTVLKEIRQGLYGSPLQKEFKLRKPKRNPKRKTYVTPLGADDFM